MALPQPNLDDRRFQDLVDEAKRMVQQRNPAWTDHNVSDPGVTLIEAFAHMVDQLIYRLNRVPDKHHVALLELIGLRLFPPVAARTDITFRLSAPQTTVVPVREGTEVSTGRTATEEAVVFSTTRELLIVPCQLDALAVRAGGAAGGKDGPAVDRTAELAGGRGVPCFSEVPQPGDSLLFGLSAAVPSCLVALRLHFPVKGHGVDPDHPPLVWEARTAEGWTPCEVESDGTGGFNRPGDILVHVPDTHIEAAEGGRRAGWLRVGVLPPDGVRRPYSGTPQLQAATAFTIGGTAPAAHAESAAAEVVGRSEGVPGQTFTVTRAPVVTGGEPFTVETSEPQGVTTWAEIEHFGGSGPDDRHFRLDRSTGEVAFGPAVRQSDGTLRQYGAVPAQGAVVRVLPYLTGGGRRGNVAPGALKVLRSSIPYLGPPANRRAATGGVDGEDVANARLRGALALRTRQRAVTAEDFEYLAGQAAPEIARVRCVAAESGPEAGAVRVLLVPWAEDDGAGRLAFEQLACSEELVQRVRDRLDRQRVIGTRLVVEPPFYQGVTVVTTLRSTAATAPALVQQAAATALYRHLNPLTGAADGTGWPFGRAVQAGEVFAVLQQVPGVELVESVRLFPADPATGRRGDPVDRIDLPAGALAFSYDHQVRVNPS
ncbi:putative baseplate assembly protein [Actinacidiphila bryophytorum]|uniref:Baseplate assembly protein n=1 Tax=Actinacidiphila bryophytorum TaxID=1436133 RepID=A0A9W4MH71_9ACTN|nr:putative baseplate assembly protein [Actinacidiphila bryophytorum]MBM9435053.1 putative baseplate assembly protein [Actinacidiphila bryophytorum]MBN6545217.1 putative baseplate assembly protein [Actinacidiphila bryophytorum]CAG7642784.1 Putative baseplate assembly protein [Actinacidiphila bryophytorum]